MTCGSARADGLPGRQQVRSRVPRLPRAFASRECQSPETVQLQARRVTSAPPICDRSGNLHRGGCGSGRFRLQGLRALPTCAIPTARGHAGGPPGASLRQGNEVAMMRRGGQPAARVCPFGRRRKCAALASIRYVCVSPVYKIIAACFDCQSHATTDPGATRPATNQIPALPGRSHPRVLCLTGPRCRLW
jgi:hypothetical protein